MKILVAIALAAPLTLLAADLRGRIIHGTGTASDFHSDGSPCAGPEPSIDEIAAKDAKRFAEKTCGSPAEQVSDFEFVRSCKVRMSIYESIAQADFKCL